MIRGLSTADEVAGKSTDCFELVKVSNVEEEMRREAEPDSVDEPAREAFNGDEELLSMTALLSLAWCSI